ncbi:MAG: TIGR00730 family Rossman fold protein [Bacteroidia bacterium]
MEANTSKHAEEQSFLEGPRSRREELYFMLKVLFEFIRGFRKFHFLGPCATVFGSARFKEEHPYYIKAREMGAALAKLGFTVMTGGGPGIMEAANRGAKESGGRSVGCNIVLPVEQKPNQYLDKWVSIDYFFIRKVLLTKYSFVFVVMPGGYGTLDEFFEALTLIQSNKVKHFPVVLFGTEYHKKLYEHLQFAISQKTISEDDLAMFFFTDSIPDAIQYIEHNAVQKFHLRQKRKRILPIPLFGEKEM